MVVTRVLVRRDSQTPLLAKDARNGAPGACLRELNLRNYS
jgi:hypothetical protein